MSNEKWTPGPWHYYQNWHQIHGTPAYVAYEETAAGGKYQGAEANAIQDVCTIREVRVSAFSMAGSNYPVKPEIEKFFKERALANAHLIAAAPELYEALEALEAIVDGFLYEDELRAARAALAKARGEA